MSRDDQNNVTVSPPGVEGLQPTYQNDDSSILEAAYAAGPGLREEISTEAEDPIDALLAPIDDEINEDPQDEEHLPARDMKNGAGRVPLATMGELQDLLLVHAGKVDAQGDWMKVRTKERVERLPHNQMTPQRLAIFLRELEKCGRYEFAAQRAGLSYKQIRSMRKKVPEFQELCDQARARFSETLEAAAYKRGVVGWKEPIIGGKDKDRVVAYKRVYDSRLLELMLKRYIPEYRERFEGELKVSGGVMVVPAKALDEADWARQHGGERLPEREGGALPQSAVPPGQLVEESVAEQVKRG